MNRPRARLRVEQLEDRWCPSLTLSYFSSSLYITGTPNGQLDIVGQSNNNFKVTDGSKNLGTFNLGGGNLHIQLASRPGNLEINLAGQTIGGSVLIDQGNGTRASKAAVFANGYSLQIFDSTASAGLSTGTIRGSLSIFNGNGYELEAIGAMEPSALTYVDLPLTIRGNVAIVGRSSSVNGEALQIAAGSEIYGSVSVTNIDDVTIGEQDDIYPTPAEIHGNVAITAAGVSTGLHANFYGLFDENVSVNGSATTSGFNEVTLAPFQNTVAGGDTVVQGNVSASFGTSQQGNEFELLTATTPGTSNLYIDGNVSLSSRAASVVPLNDVYQIQAQIGGSLTANMGYGDNNFELFGVATVGGSVTITGGNGNNTISVDANANFPGFPTIKGNLTINLGSGTNNATITEAIGGTLYWNSGNGQSTLTLGDGSVDRNFQVFALFGNDDDTFNMNLGTNGILSGRVDGGGREIANIFNQISGNLASPGVIVNFP